tara:strand:+ start:34 stop:510 length:477 start_codon:yes stop_codon:yes gene_type:complete
MLTKKFKGIWFYGLSGSGKTISSKFLKKKLKNSIIIDGDNVRKLISFDLSYSLKDRKIQIKRINGIVKISIASNIFPIASSVYMNEELNIKLKKQKVLVVRMLRRLKSIKNRKKIYKSKIVNVVGKDIKMPKLSNIYIIKNDQSVKNLQKKLEKVFYE